MTRTLLDPTSERSPSSRQRLQRPETLAGLRVGLLDISKARGNVFLDRLEELLSERKAIVTRAERLHRIEDWNRAARATPHGKPIELIRCEKATGIAQSTNRTPLASSL